MHEFIPVSRPTAGAGANAAQLVRAVDELELRRSRAADHAGENRALVSLMRELSGSPATILQKLVETILDLCNAHSAGVSLLDESRTRFYWPAIAGQWADKVGGGTPRDFGPCGTVLDRNEPLLFTRPDRLFPYLVDARPAVESALLYPFYVDGEAVGTIWTVTHDSTTSFDSEDVRLMQTLANFASAAFQMLRSLEESAVARQADHRLASIVESCNDAIVSKNLDGTITSWNKAAERLFGYTADEIVGKPVTILFPPGREDEELRIIERIRVGERVEHYETVRRHKDGSLLNVSLTISPVKNANNEVIGASKIARDITDQKNLEKAKKLLLREMKHRVKNTLATVQSLASQTFRNAPANEREAFFARLHALSGSHDLLTDENMDSASVKDVIAFALAPFQGEAPNRYKIGGPTAWINASDVLRLSMATHELATNAVKYGALSNATGSVEFSWDRVPGSRLIRLSWQETGGPPVQQPERRGFGSALIAHAFGQEAAKLEFEPSGLKCTLLIALEE